LGEQASNPEGTSAPENESGRMLSEIPVRQAENRTWWRRRESDYSTILKTHKLLKIKHAKNAAFDDFAHAIRTRLFHSSVCHPEPAPSAIYTRSLFAQPNLLHFFLNPWRQASFEHFNCAIVGYTTGCCRRRRMWLSTGFRRCLKQCG